MSDDARNEHPIKPEDAALNAPAKPPEPSQASPGMPRTTTDLSALRSTQNLSDLTNNKCPTCGLVNRVGVLVCENCGTSLLSGAASIPTTRILQEKNGETGHLATEKVPVLPPKTDGNSPATVTDETKVVPQIAQPTIVEETIVTFEILGAPPIPLLPKKENMVGRKDVSTGTQPDVDLTPYAGYRMGVSRRHAMVRMYDKRIEIMDLGSSNGSRLNGVVLQAHQPHLLKDGDLLTLGKLDLRVSFKTPSGITRMS